MLTDGPATRADRPASAVLYDSVDARVVGFHLLPGQRVAEHRSTSTVTIHVTEGSGVFRGAESASRLEAGQIGDRRVGRDRQRAGAEGFGRGERSRDLRLRCAGGQARARGVEQRPRGVCSGHDSRREVLASSERNALMRSK